MTFYQTVADLYRGERTANHGDAKIIKTGLEGLTNAHEALVEIAKAADTHPLKSESILYAAIVQAAPYACSPKTQSSATKWLELQPTSNLAQNWIALKSYANERSCCGGCPLMKK